MGGNPEPQAPNDRAGTPQAAPNNADDQTAHEQENLDGPDPNAQEDDLFHGDAARAPEALIDTSSPSTTAAVLAANRAGSPLAAPVSDRSGAFRSDNGWLVLVAIMMLIAGLAVLGIAGRARRGC